MRKKKNHKFKYIGICTSLLIITIIVMILSLVFSKLGINGNITSINNDLLESSLVVTKNIFSIEGIKYILNTTVDNFRNFEPLIILILSILSVGILEKSGFLFHVFNKFGKLKINFILAITIIVSMALGFFGEYSYVVLFPFVAAIYKSMNKNPLIGIITVFLAGTFGYGIGSMINNDMLAMSTLTQAGAILDVDPTYKYSTFSTLYISIFFMILLIVSLVVLINGKIVEKLKRGYAGEEIVRQTSKKGLIVSLIVLAIFLIGIVLLFIPKLGFMDKNETQYFMSLFGENSVFKNGMMYMLLFACSIIGIIYGKMSKNFQNDMEANLNLSGDFDKIGIVFIIMFLSIQLTSILDYTNIGTILITGVTNFISGLELTGILLILFFVIFVIFTSFFIPSLIGKWAMMSPIIVPLFMRANIAPEFCQFVYLISNTIGRIISPFYIYFLIMIGYLYKYSNGEVEITLGGIRKLILPTILIISGIMLLSILLWYISGLPIGLSGHLTL